MSISGLIKCNSISNAYACYCQFISRIKPAVQNFKDNIKRCPSDSMEFNQNAALLDIYYQIKAGLNDIDISPFIRICDYDNKTTHELIPLLKTVLLHFDSNLKPIFYASLLDNTTIKFQKSVIYDFKFIESYPRNIYLTDSIQKRYEYISTKSKILLFTPSNQSKFNLSFFLSLEEHSLKLTYSLFSFVLTKKNNANNYILYIAQSSDIQKDWLCIDKDTISIVSHKALKNLSQSEENNFILFAFTENLEENIEFLSPNTTEISVMELTPISEAQNQSAHSTQSSTPHLISSSSQLEQIDNQLPMPSLPQKSENSPTPENSPSSPKRHKNEDKPPKESSFFDDTELSLNANNECSFTLKVLKPQTMEFNDIYTKKTKFEKARQKINRIIQKNGILKAFYSIKSEKHSIFHNHIRYDKEIYVYVQKPNDPQILKYYLNSKKINIKFVCHEIKIFNTTATFDTQQPLSDLYDFCHILLENVLGIKVEKIELFRKRSRITEHSKLLIGDMFEIYEDNTVFFSYKEKYLK